MESKASTASNRPSSKDDDDNDIKGEDNNVSLVEEFVSYLNSSTYNQQIQDFFEENYHGFEDYHKRQQNGIGNKIEWTNIYQQYLELVGHKLQQFCNDRNVDPVLVYSAIEQYIKKFGEGEFIPLFLKTTDETYFYEQMYSYANESSLRRNVEEISRNEGKGEESMSGVWHSDPDAADESQLSHWLETLGIPWVFRKLVLRSQRSPSKVMIAHIPNQQFEISTSLPIFGSWTIQVALDGKWQSGSNRLGDPVRVYGTEDSQGVHIQLKNTKSGTLTMFQISFKEEQLVLYRELYLSGIENGSPDATLHTYLLR